jgi:arginine N-succinyltransferase
MLIRPVRLTDHAALMSLAQQAGYGFTSLPQDAEVLEAKITASEHSFAGRPLSPDDHRFLFVMEDSTTGQIVGSTGIKAHVGLTSPFYSYKLSKLVQANKQLGIYTANKVLHMVNDFTGVSEIGSLFLLPEYRRDGLGRFLSRCRFLALAEYADLFDSIVIAEMRGVHDAEGNSHFYDNLARHFFQMSFSEADYINATKGGQFITDLMPRYPIYVELLAQEAQAVIGKVNEASLPAVKLLEREGFVYSGYVDIFDAGPTMRVQREHIATVRASAKVTVRDITDEPPARERMMMLNPKLSHCRMVLDGALCDASDGIAISRSAAERLQVKMGDELRVAF